MSEELPEITRSIYGNPKNPGFLVHRAMNFSKLGFADLAAGDAYKAIQFLDARLRLFLGDSKSNYEDLSGDLRAATAGGTNLQKSSYLWLGSILKDTNDLITAQTMIQEARVRYPSDPDLENEEKSIATRLEVRKMAQQLQTATINTNLFSFDSTFGTVFHVAYPFIPKNFLGRNEELIQKTKKEIEKEAMALFSGCSLRPSTVQDPTDLTSSGTPTALGIFATCDIPGGAPFLIDTPVLAATENYRPTCDALEICDNCCGTIPTNSTQKRSADCCKVLYCTQKCKNLAWKNYHQVLCKQDFSWVWEDSKTSISRYDLDGPMWLRILAVCVQSQTHPLEHPLIARLTPLYDEHAPRRWSLSNNIIMPIKILQQLGIDTYADSRFDTWVLQCVWLRIVTNAQGSSNVSKV